MCMDWEPVWREKPPRMANFALMCALFRINSILSIEIEQLEDKLQVIKELCWLNLSVEILTEHYKAQIASKKAQIIANRSAASNIVTAAIQQ